MQTQTKNHPEPALEQLKDKLKEYERWFRTLDSQVRILERERQKLLALVNNTDAGYLVVDSSLKITWANEAFVKRFGPGLHISSILGAKCNQILCKQAHICEVCPGPKTFISGEVVHYEVRLDLGGEARQIYVTAMPIKSPEGRISEAFIMLQDITDLEVLRRSQEALKASEQKFRTVISKAPLILFALDKNGIIILSEGKGLEPPGLKPGQVIGQSVFELYKDVPQFLENIRRALKGEEFSCVVKLKGQAYDSWYAPIRGRKGEVTGVIGVANDITERTRAEEALQQVELQYKELVETIQVIAWRADAKTFKFNFVSKEAEKLLGYPIEQWTSDANFWRDHIHPDDREWAISYCLKSTQDRMPHEFEYRMLAADGKIVWLRDIVRIIVEDGQVKELIGVMVDITEGKKVEEALYKSEEQLRQAQKMEAIGRLAGGVAHDFNNLLTIIMGRCQLLLRKFGAEETLNRDINLILSTSERAALLTKQLLAFSRKQVLQPRVLDLNEVVSDMDKMLRRMIGEDIELVTVLAKNLGKVKADPGQVSQVILNLVVNARDAMPSGGKMTIETDNVEINQKNQHLYSVAEIGSYVNLTVNDTGSGIEPETLPQIFEPFFTTKEKGKGTGLGLATVYGIIKQSGGHIWVNSLPKQGATFKVYLPKVEETVEPKVQISEKVKQKGALETILLVEDESDVRELIGDLLRENGFTVLEAGHSGEAIEICQKYERPIQLLLTDVVMPQMSGPELAKLLVPMRPEIRVLFISGYTDTAVVSQGWLAPGTAFLQKPFTQEILVNKIREVLDHRPAGK
ncbi:MAG TPA: PAS domain S-box protein [candidate division Zixibacteria bacterium]|nr:PAS domain S-box protein [candidate division Zixibacteria bacterium]